MAAGLARLPAVILIGARQTGKSSLARRISTTRPSKIYDLEKTTDLRALDDYGPELRRHSDKLVIIDEVQKRPELFSELRVIIDELRAAGQPTGKFLLLGSVTGKLQRQTQGLTGRVTQIQLHPFDWLEVADRQQQHTVWNRGGYPGSLLAATDSESEENRRDYIEKALDKDALSARSRVRATDYRSLLRLLADRQKDCVKRSALGAELKLAQNTVTAMLANLEEMMLIRRLPAYTRGMSQRIAKTPKYYICDSGIFHSIINKSVPDLGARTLSRLRGASWEGFVLQNIIAVLPPGWEPYFFRSHSSGNEVDLVLEKPGGDLWAIEIKAGTGNISPDRKFVTPLQHLAPARSFLVHGGSDNLRAGAGRIEIVSLAEIMNELLAAGPALPEPAEQRIVEPGTSFAAVMQALAGNEAPLINLRRAQFLQHFSGRFEKDFASGCSPDDDAVQLWAQARNELLEWLAREAARAPELPEAGAWLEGLLELLAQLGNMQAPESAHDPEPALGRLCCHDLFVNALAVLLQARSFRPVSELVSRKYCVHKRMLSCACFRVQPAASSQGGRRPSAGSLARVAAFMPAEKLIEAELVPFVHGILTRGSEDIWKPRILQEHPGTPVLPFFVQAEDRAGARNLLLCLDLPADAANMKETKHKVTGFFAEWKGEDESVDWEQIQRCLNMPKWHDLH